MRLRRYSILGCVFAVFLHTGYSSRPSFAQVGAPPAPAPAAAPPAAAAPAAVPPALIPAPFNEAVSKAVTALLNTAAQSDVVQSPRELVIDPLIDGYTGAQNPATNAMGELIVGSIKKTSANMKVIAFTPEALSKQPLVLIGTFRPVNSKNDPAGSRDVHHICLALLDLKTGKIVSKGASRSLPEGVDTTPTQFFQDSPVWVSDAPTSAYVKSCQATKVGDPIEGGYADAIVAASLISQAIQAYDNKNYKDALDLYKSALRTPGGDQLRAYNGVYLSSWRLKRQSEAAEAFGKLVDYGLKGSKVAVNFLFVPNSTIFFNSNRLLAPYPMWIKAIGERGTAQNSCLEIVGHTSRTGPPAVNERLSVLRAQYVRDKIIDNAPSLANRTIATGVGSRETIVGTDTDGPHNALDRRVEFKPIQCRQS